MIKKRTRYLKLSGYISFQLHEYLNALICYILVLKIIFVCSFLTTDIFKVLGW